MEHIRFACQLCIFNVKTDKVDSRALLLEGKANSQLHVYTVIGKETICD
jgi:hypothetical protein